MGNLLLVLNACFCKCSVSGINKQAGKPSAICWNMTGFFLLCTIPPLRESWLHCLCILNPRFYFPPQPHNQIPDPSHLWLLLSSVRALQALSHHKCQFKLTFFNQLFKQVTLWNSQPLIAWPSSFSSSSRFKVPPLGCFLFPEEQNYSRTQQSQKINPKTASGENGENF